MLCQQTIEKSIQIMKWEFLQNHRYLPANSGKDLGDYPMANNIYSRSSSTGNYE